MARAELVEVDNGNVGVWNVVSGVGFSIRSAVAVKLVTLTELVTPARTVAWPDEAPPCWFGGC